MYSHLVRNSLKALVPTLFLFLTIPMALAQQPPRVYEKLDVKLRQLQVNVVTKKGDAIKGLTADDFQVIVDGKKQNIVDATEIALDQLNQSPETPFVSEMARRLFVFFFDFQYTTKLGLLNARKSAADFVVNKMYDKDIAAVVTFHPDNGIELLCPFTNDRQLLHQAIDTLGLVTTTQRGRSGYYNNNALVRNFGQLDQTNSGIDTLIEAGEDPNDGPGASPEMVALINEQRILSQLAAIFQRAKNVEQDIYRADVNKFLLQFQGFGDALNQIRGRKNLIWFSSGFDEQALTGNSNSQIREDTEAASHGEIWEISSDATGHVGVQTNLSDAVSFLQNSNTIIFAVDTGLNENATGGQSGLQSLNAFSKDTGGKLFRNANDLSKSLEEIRDLTNHYYLLTFEPSANLDTGEPLKLRIKTSAKGSRVHANRSITLGNDFSKLSPLGRTFQVSDYLARDLVSTAVPFSLQHFSVPGEGGINKVMVLTDIERAYLEKADAKEPIQFEVFVQAIRQSDQVVFDSFYFRFGIDGKKLKKNEAAKGLRYFTDLFLAPGNYKLKVVARNLATGEVGSQIEPLIINEASEALQGPYVIAQEPWIFVRPDADTQKSQRGLELDFRYPFQIQGQMQVPATVDRFSLQDSYGFYFFLDNKNTAPPTERPKMNAVIMDDQQKLIPIPGEAIAAGADFGEAPPYLTGVMFKIDFSKLELQPGKTYKLLSQFVYPDKAPLRTMYTIETTP